MDSELSIKIANLRLPLCLGVIAIHSYSPSIDVGEAMLDREIVNFFAHILPSICVPIFFVISGYLLGYKYHIRNNCDYLKLLRKRCRSLLLPFVVWNLLAFTVRLAIKKSPLGYLTSNVYHFDSLSDFLIDVLWVPELVPLWFMRNLLLFVVAYPVILWAVKNLKVFTLLITYCLDTYCDMYGIFYFSGGVWCACSLSENRIIQFLRNFRWLLVVFIIGALFKTFTSFPFFNYTDFCSLWQLCGVLGVIAVCPGDKSYAPVGSGGVFFLYAVHGLISPYIIKGVGIIGKHALPEVVNYFLCFVLIVAASYGAWLLCRHLPNVLRSLLTGSR